MLSVFRQSAVRSLVALLAIAASMAACAHAPASTSGESSPGADTSISSSDAAAEAPTGIVPWLDVAAAPYVPPTAAPLPRDAPPCHATDLAAKVDPLGFGLGNSNLPVRFINQSASACLLAGYPTVAGITAAGKVVPLDASHGSYFGDPGPTTNIGTEQTAALNISGADACDAAMTAKRIYPMLRIGLPVGGSIDVPSNGFDTICGVFLSQFGVPAADVTASMPPPSPLVATINAPPTGTPGTVLAFTVTLANPTDEAVVFPTCPAYTEFVGSGDVGGWVATIDNYVLNCEGQPIPAGGQTTYAMELRLPANQPLGIAKFGWDIEGDSGPWAGAPLTIVAP